jgi:hypothetical protein
VVRVPRGTKGRLPWTNQLDLGLTYTPNWAEGLLARVEVTNVLGTYKETSVIETAEVRATGLPSSTYMLPASFQPNRQVRFILQYDF